MEKNKLSKTENKIIKSFLEILSEKSFDKTHIVDICERAGVTKVTFYYHYKSKTDLFRKILNVYLEKLTKVMDEELKRLNVKHVSLNELFYVFFSAVMSFEEQINELLTNDNDHYIYKEFTIFLSENLKYTFKKFNVVESTGIPLDLLCSYYSGAISNSVFYLLQNKEISKEEKVNYLHALLRRPII